MRVAFDEQIFLLQRTGGISRYFVELADALTADPTIEVLLPTGPVAATIAAQRWQRSLLTGSVRRRLSLQRARRRAAAPDCDLWHATFYDPAWLAVGDRSSGPRRVVTVVDMIPEAMPDHVPAGVHQAKREYVAAADLVLTISEFTRDELIRYYGPIAAPVVVTPLGVAPEFFHTQPPPLDLPPESVLFVGNRAGYKDFATVAAAVADLPSPIQLVAVGGGPWTAAEAALLDRLGIRDRVMRVDVTDAELVGAYRAARTVVVPSRYEGFGLPVVEALAAGADVVAADVPALVEVGADAVRYFPAGDPAALAAALNSAPDPEARSAVAAASRRRAGVFTWQRTAALTAAAYRSVVG